MTTETTATEQEQGEADESQKGTCDECDPELIDVLKCKSKGIEAQAKYNAEHQADLDKAQTDYIQTRKDYRTKRCDVALQVQDMRHQIKHLVDRIRCMFKQERVVDCLDEAWQRVVAQLDECGDSGGCCIDDDDCKFNADPSKLDDRKLNRRITNYTHRVTRAKDCFTKLVGEPTDLGKRVTDCKTELDTINAALSADPANTDLKKVYASALVARRHINQVWGGFDAIKDFVDCLCRALTCWSKGSAVISELLGEQAIRDCHRQAHDARCKELQTNPVDEVLTVYDKICPAKECHDSDDNGKGNHKQQPRPAVGQD